MLSDTPQRVAVAGVTKESAERCAGLVKEEVEKLTRAWGFDPPSYEVVAIDPEAKLLGRSTNVFREYPEFILDEWA
jgi:hypothetical protein